MHIASYAYLICSNIDESIITEEIIMDAIKMDERTIMNVKNPSHEMYLTAVKSNGLAIEYIKDPPYDLCLEAVKSSAMALKYIEYQTEEICLEAFKTWERDIAYLIKNGPHTKPVYDISKKNVSMSDVALKYENNLADFIYDNLYKYYYMLIYNYDLLSFVKRADT